MRTDVYIALNLQSCFLDKAGSLYIGDGPAAALVSSVSTFLSGKEDSTLYTKIIRRPEDCFYMNEPSYCLVGSKDLDFVRFIDKSAVHKLVYHRPSLMHSPDFRSFLKSRDVETVHVVGLETHSSGLFTVADLRDAGYHVKVYPALMSSRDVYLHESAISLMASTLSAEVCDV